MRKYLAVFAFSLALFPVVTFSQLEITEFMASNRTGLTDEDGDTEDWIELHNAGNEVVSLDGLYLTDNLEVPDKWALPSFSLEPSGFLVIFASNKDRDDPAGTWHTNFRLAAGGDLLALTNGTEVLSGFASPYPVQVPDVSYSEADGFMSKPTPGQPNDISLGKPVSEVKFSLPSQAFGGTLTLELSTETPDAEILYALEGLAPSLFNAKRYEGPIEIDRSMFITAVAKKNGQPNSALTTGSFVHLDEDVAAFESNLPLVVLDSHGTGRPDQGDYNRFSLSIFQNDEGRTTLARESAVAESAQIRIRGQSSSGFAKKQYRMEIIDSGEEEKSVPLLGLPRESDWVLGAPYADEALIRNAVVYELGRDMGLEASRTAYCELFLKTDDGSLTMDDYEGVYVLTEAIEISNSRIDLKNLTPQDNEEPRISGGYIIRHEAGVSEPPRIKGAWRHFEIMEPAEISEEQIDWISDYVNAFDQVLRSEEVNDPVDGYAKYIDVDSFVDTLIINEFAREQDSYVRSAYWHKDREGKLVSGPLWDYNLSFGVSCCFNSHEIEDWQYEHNYNRRGEESSSSIFDWNTPLLADPDFLQRLKDRYFALRQGILNIDQFNERIDRHAGLVGDNGAEDSPAHRNHDRWRTLGKRTTGFQSGLYDFKEDEFRALTERSGIIYDTWEQHIDHIKIWADLRLQWMDDGWIHPRLPKVNPAPGEFEGMVEVSQRSPSLFNKGGVYYTLDGSDPRAAGGEPATTALSVDPLVLTESSTLTSRFRLSPDELWSPPFVGRYRVDERAPSRANLVISEIMYHPADPTEAELAVMPDLNDDDFEYLEIANSGDAPVDLVGLRFSREVDVNLPRTGTLTLQPGAFAVVVRDEAAFRLRYGDKAHIVGTFGNDRLDNGGGTVRLRGFHDEILIEFDYSDDEPWPVEADGDGSAIVLNNWTAEADLEDPNNWVAMDPSPGDGEQDSGGPAQVVVLTKADFDQENDRLTLGWRSLAGDDYQVQRSLNLIDWESVGEVMTAAGEESETELAVEPQENVAAYYRVARQ